MDAVFQMFAKERGETSCGVDRERPAITHIRFEGLSTAARAHVKLGVSTIKGLSELLGPHCILSLSEK